MRDGSGRRGRVGYFTRQVPSFTSLWWGYYIELGLCKIGRLLSGRATRPDFADRSVEWRSTVYEKNVSNFVATEALSALTYAVQTPGRRLAWHSSSSLRRPAAKCVQSELPSPNSLVPSVPFIISKSHITKLMAPKLKWQRSFCPL